jgi:hypothetical protein
LPNPTHPNAIHRQRLLAVLYAAREAKPAQGWVNERDLASSAAAAPPPGACQDIAFALDVLGELGLVKRNGFDLRITGAGVLACEAA